MIWSGVGRGPSKIFYLVFKRERLGAYKKATEISRSRVLVVVGCLLLLLLVHMEESFTIVCPDGHVL